MLSSREWMEELGDQILDPDGWREESAPDFDTDLIPREDYETRFCKSTVLLRQQRHGDEPI
jgi:hypothetical protein